MRVFRSIVLDKEIFSLISLTLLLCNGIKDGGEVRNCFVDRSIIDFGHIVKLGAATVSIAWRHIFLTPKISLLILRFSSALQRENLKGSSFATIWLATRG